MGARSGVEILKFMHVHATVVCVEILVVGVEMHARARATGKATPAAIYSYSRNALPVLVRDGSTADLLALNLRCGRCLSARSVHV